MRILTIFDPNPTKVEQWINIFNTINTVAREQEGENRVMALHRGIPARTQAWVVTKAKQIRSRE